METSVARDNAKKIDQILKRTPQEVDGASAGKRPIVFVARQLLKISDMKAGCNGEP